MDVVEGISNSIEDISHHTLSLIQIKWKYHLKMIYVLLYDGRLSSMNDLLPILEGVSQQSKPLVLMLTMI